MIITQTFRFGRDLGLEELNGVLATIHPNQIRLFQASSPDQHSIEVVLVWDDDEYLEVVEAHPHHGSQFTSSCIPTEFVILFSGPIQVDGAQLFFDLLPIDSSRLSVLNNYAMKVNLVGLPITTGDHRLWGHVVGQNNRLSKEGLLGSFRIGDGVPEVPHNFGEPNFKQDGKIRCEAFIVDKGGTLQDAMVAANERMNIDANDILFQAVTDQGQNSQATFIIYWEEKAPGIKFGDPGHGAVFAKPVSEGYFGFDMPLADSGDFGTVYHDGIAVPGTIVDPTRNVAHFSITPNPYGVHWWLFEDIKGANGSIRSRPIISSYAFDDGPVSSGDLFGPSGELTNIIRSGEPNGFENREDVAIAFDLNNNTFSIQPVGDEYYIFVDGVRHIINVEHEIPLDETEGLHFIYFDDTPSLIISDTFDDQIVRKYAYVAVYYWDATNSKVIYQGDERHENCMSGATHEYLHRAFGTRYGSGLAIGNYDDSGNGDDNEHAQMSFSDGVIHDEDIDFTIANGDPQTLSPIAHIPIFYRTGAGGLWRRKDADAFPLIQDGVEGYTAPNGRIACNDPNAGGPGVWGLTEVTNGDFTAVWVFATTDLLNPIMGILDQNTDYGSLHQAENNAIFENLALDGLPFQEIKILYRLIFQSGNGFTNSVKARLREVLDLRNAQLGREFIPTLHSSLAGLDNPDHPASAIYTDSGEFSDLLADEEDVQSALEAIDSHTHDGRYYTETEIDALLGDQVEKKTISAADFIAGDGTGNTLKDIIVGSPAQIGIRTDAGNEQIQINIGGTIFKWSSDF